MAGIRYLSFVSLSFFVVMLTRRTSAQPTWRIRPRNSTVQLGRNVTFYCEIDNLIGGYSVVWQKEVDILFINHDRQMADPRYQITGQLSRGQFNLVVTNAKREDDHAYRCSVGNAGLLQNAHLTVIAPPEQPTLTIDRSDALTAGEEIKLMCSSRGGNPSPAVRWFRAGQLISGTSVVDTPAKDRFGVSTSVLTWRLSGSDHNMLFSCAVENAGNMGNPLTATRRLVVQYGPVVRISPYGSVKVIESTSFTLTCQVNANPPVTSVTWFKGGVRQPETSLVFRVDSALRGHSTTYECVASNKIGEGRNTTSVDVLYPPRITVKEAVDGQVLVNISGTVRLTCEVDSHPTPNVIRWRKAGLVDTISGSSLILYDVQKTDAGLYLCEAENTLNPSNGQSVTVQRNASVNIVVTYAPGITMIEQVTEKAVIGQDVTLRCSAQDQGVPAASLHWSKEGNPGFSHQGPELTLRALTWDHRGIYACVARNRVGEGLPGRKQLKIYEGVSFLPPLLESVKYVRVTDSELSVICEARGEPAPAITWYKNGQAILPGSAALFTVTVTQQVVDKYSHRVTSQLQWLGEGRHPKRDSLTPDDAGNYTCVAGNSVAADKRQSVLLIIEYSPVVQVSASKVASGIGETATLTCGFKALPKPTVSWFLGNQRVIDSMRVTITTSRVDGSDNLYESRMRISNLVEKDFEVYSCVAENHLGNSSGTVQLTKRGPPDSPTQLTLGSLTWESALLQWVPGFNGGHPQSYIISFTAENMPEKQISIQSEKVTKYNVSGLFPSSRYSFTVSAVNEKGRSQPSQNLFARTQDFNIAPPTEVVYSTETRVLTFVSSTQHTCARIMLSDDGKAWRLYEPCVPSAGGSVKITTDSSFSQVNVSLCLERRQDICSPSVLAKFIGPGNVVSLTVVIAIVCSVIAVLVVMVIVALVFHCNRRKKAQGASKTVGNSKLYHQATTSSDKPSSVNKQTVKPNNTTKAHAEKSFMMAPEQSSYPHHHRVPGDGFDQLTSKPWSSQMSQPHNFYPPPPGQSYHLPEYSQVKPQYIQQQNPTFPDVFNSSGESLPSRNSGVPLNNYKPDTHSQSSEESGYSTPTKPSKKVIREIVV